MAKGTNKKFATKRSPSTALKTIIRILELSCVYDWFATSLSALLYQPNELHVDGFIAVYVH